MDLRHALRKTGAPSLAALVGSATLNAAKNILSQDITESMMVDILVDRLGSQILANSSLRAKVMEILSDEDLAFLHFSDRSLPIEVSLRGRNISWGRNQLKSKRLLEILGLDDSFLPEEIEEVENTKLIKPNFHLFDYQKKIKDRGVEVLHQPSARLLIHMPTGSGKTRTTAELLVDFWRGSPSKSNTAVWLAHSEELCSQAAETIESVWSNRGDSELTVHRLWSDSQVPESIGGTTLIVASLQKIYSMWKSNSEPKRDLIRKIRENCKLIVIDEAHKAIAPTYQDAIEAIENLQDTRVLGLTATPGRGEDALENQRLVEFFSGNKITLQDDNNANLDDPIGFLQDKKYLARITRRAIPTNIDLHLNELEVKHLERFFDLPASVIKRLGEDTERNALIMMELAKLFEAGRTIIVFACSVEHARLLNDLCRIRGITARSIDGETAKIDRKKWIDEFKSNEYKILINYGVLTTGFDAPNTDTVMITRPTGSVVLYSQMIGRGIRGLKMGGNEECLLVDLEDNLQGYPNESRAFNYFDWPEEN